jgi:hypothetical protein
MTAEITYFPEVRCRVFPGGLYPGGVTARVEDVAGRPQFIQAVPGLINSRDGADYLVIGIVEIDRRSRRVLIEFPVEADSGANRIWVDFDGLHHEPQEHDRWP